MTQRYLLLALLCLAWILPGLIGHDPWKSDEAYTFGVVYDMLQGGSWLVPTLAGEPFLDEPPLYYLTAALTALVASPVLPLHDGARLATGLFMALTLLFCAMAAREASGAFSASGSSSSSSSSGKDAGMVCALLVLGSFGLLLRGHEIITDSAPLAGYALAYYALALGLRKPLAAGVSLGVALGMVFLSQGVLETLILLVIMALLPVVSSAWRTRDYAKVAGIAVIAAAPLIVAWPLALHLRSPELFALWLQRDWLVMVNGVDRDITFYARILPWHTWPLWLLAAWRLWMVRRKQDFTPAIALPVTGAAVTFVMLSLLSGARDLYALILLPPLALLAAPAVLTLRRGAANAWFWFSIMGVTVFIVAGWFYWCALELGVPARLHAHLHRLQPGYTAGLKIVPVTLAALFTVAWFVLLARVKRSAGRPAIVWAAGVTVLWGIATSLFTGVVDTGRSYRAVFEEARRHVPVRHTCVASRSLGDAQRALLHYHAGLVTKRLETSKDAAQCDVLMTQGVVREDLSPPLPGWRKIWEGMRVGDKVERYRLYQRNS